MQTILTAATLAALALGATAPAFAASQDGTAVSVQLVAGTADIEKRKKPRVKGGSGCDSAHDASEHAACR